MSGLEIASLVLGGFPLLFTAIESYKSAKSGRVAAQLSRRMKTESIIYHQFLRNLVQPHVSEAEFKQLFNQESTNTKAWQDENLLKQVQERLGVDTTNHIFDQLHEMDQLLKQLAAELSNISKGTEVLDKLRSRLKATTMAMSPNGVQARLAQLADMNRDIRRLVEGNTTNPFIPTTTGTPKSQKITNFLHRNSQEPTDAFNAIRDGFHCGCFEPHLTDLACNCPSCLRPLTLSTTTQCEWVLTLVFRPHAWELTHTTEVVMQVGDTQSTQTSLSVSRGESSDQSPHRRRRTSWISVLLDELHHHGQQSGGMVINDLCSALENIEQDESVSNDCLGILGKSSKMYRLSLDRCVGAKGVDVICLSDLMRPGSLGTPRFSMKARMLLAFRLSLMVLQLYMTPWIDESWNWQNFGILKDAELDEDAGDDVDGTTKLWNLLITRNLLISQKFYSDKVKSVAPGNFDSPWSIATREPILAKLGFALIELLFDKSLEKLRDENPHWRGKEITEDNTFDKNFLDLWTARMLLETDRVGGEAGLGYENVVRACIDLQYRDGDGCGIRGIDSSDKSFLDSAEEAILMPLHSKCREFLKQFP